MLPAQPSSIWCSLFQVVLSPVCRSFKFITLFFCRQGRRHMLCFLPHGRFCVTETRPRNSLPLNFLFSFFSQCRSVFLSPGLSRWEHRGSLNAVCAQPHVSSVILHVGGGSLPFTNISPSHFLQSTIYQLKLASDLLLKWEKQQNIVCWIGWNFTKHLLNVHMLKSHYFRLSPRGFQARFWVIFTTFELLFPEKVEKHFPAKMDFFTNI